MPISEHLTDRPCKIQSLSGRAKLKTPHDWVLLPQTTPKKTARVIQNWKGGFHCPWKCAVSKNLLDYSTSFAFFLRLGPATACAIICNWCGPVIIINRELSPPKPKNKIDQVPSRAILKAIRCHTWISLSALNSTRNTQPAQNSMRDLAHHDLGDSKRYLTNKTRI